MTSNSWQAAEKGRRVGWGARCRGLGSLLLAASPRSGVVPHDASAFSLADLRSQKASQPTTLDSPSLVDCHSLAIPIPWNKDHQALPKFKNGQAA